MGNRAVITTSKSLDVARSTDIGVYLHWNGGRDSVEAFLKYCKLKGYRSPETDCYGWARFCQVIGNFFAGGLSLGIDKCCNLDCDNYDNWTYIIENWEIVDRKYFEGHEQSEHDINEMLKEIDGSQPKSEQLGDFLSAKEIPISELKVGDVVFFYDNIYNKYVKHTVVGFGENERVNGLKAYGVPYVDMYGNEDKGYAWNSNNYIRTETIRVCK